jgi:hypothetical protein
MLAQIKDLEVLLRAINKINALFRQSLTGLSLLNVKESPKA